MDTRGLVAGAARGMGIAVVEEYGAFVTKHQFDSQIQVS